MLSRLLTLCACGHAMCPACLVQVRTMDPSDDLTFLRIRSKQHEILVAPDKEYSLIVIQNPNLD